MKRGNIWLNRPIPEVGHGGLFLLGIVAEEEWHHFTWDARAYHEQELYEEHKRFAEEMEQLYLEFWGPCATI